MHPIRKVKQAFALFISTFSNLADAIREQTYTNRTIEAASARRHSELIAAIASVEVNTRYLAASERASLQRAGHRHEL